MTGYFSPGYSLLTGRRRRKGPFFFSPFSFIIKQEKGGEMPPLGAASTPHHGSGNDLHRFRGEIAKRHALFLSPGYTVSPF